MTVGQQASASRTLSNSDDLESDYSVALAHSVKRQDISCRAAYVGFRFRFVSTDSMPRWATLVTVGLRVTLLYLPTYYL